MLAPISKSRAPDRTLLNSALPTAVGDGNKLIGKIFNRAITAQMAIKIMKGKISVINFGFVKLSV
jgi:hypothetical protein